MIKNLTAVGPSGNVKPIPIFHGIPPSSSSIVKITVDTDSGEIDITDSIIKADFSVGVTSTIGDFSLSFIDPLKTNLNLISNFDDVYLYADYGSSATTKRFRFKIENKGYTDFNTNLSGRGIGMILSSKSIIYQTLDVNDALTYKNKSDVIIEIIQQNFSNITDFSQIESDTTQIQKSYFEIPFFDIIEELCGNDKYFYLDKDLIPHYFTKGSVQNSTEGITDSNLVYMNDNSENSEEIYTRVRVYGSSEGGIPIIATSNIGTTNTGGINKDYIINNTSIVSTIQAQALADSEANRITSSTRVKDIICLLLPSLSPGESLFIGLPEFDIDPNYYNIKEFNIKIDINSDFPYTNNFIIEKKRQNVPIVVKDIIQTQKEIVTNDNPNDLDFSQIIIFDVDTGTHSNTEINEGYLKVKIGQSTGTWISEIFSLDDDVTAIELRWSGDLLVSGYGATSSQLWFSLNGGSTWKLYSVGDATYPGSIPSGRDLRVKVVLGQSTAKVKRIGVYYDN